MAISSNLGFLIGHRPPPAYRLWDIPGCLKDLEFP
jgi:hypothetical protein